MMLSSAPNETWKHRVIHSEKPDELVSSTRNIHLHIVDIRPLIRSCFGDSLRTADALISVSYFDTIDAVAESGISERPGTQLVLYCGSWPRSQVGRNLEVIQKFTSDNLDVCLILLSEIEEFEDVMQAFKSGVRGFIPTSASLDVAVQAIRLVEKGGMYIPHAILAHVGDDRKRLADNPGPAPADPFTNRQMSVISALRKGKPNKIIAYELNMCESTVKVHIRNIMKRLNAKNRTEVAYLLNEMESDGRIAPANGGDVNGLL